MSHQRKSDLSRKIQACTTTYSKELLNIVPQFSDKSFLEMLDGFAVGSSMNQISSQMNNLSIQLPRYISKVITYYELNENVKKTDEIIGKLSVLGITALYSTEVQQTESLISGFLTVLNAHCTPQQFKLSGIAKTLDSMMGYNIQPQKITIHQLEHYFLQELQTFAINSAIHCGHKDFYKFAIVIGLSSLLFLGNAVLSENIERYLSSKWELLALHVRCDKLTIRMPNAYNCKTIYNFFMNDRKEVFEFYRSLTKQLNNRYKAAFEFIVESLSWADMEYIHLIDKYIVEKNPEILSLFKNAHLFGTEKTRMKQVYKLMEQLPQSDHPFLKLILPSNQRSVITRKNFQNLYGAALAVASIDNPNITYINREDTLLSKNMKNQIRIYVMQKKGEFRI